jgi:hypothetical protein
MMFAAVLLVVVAWQGGIAVKKASLLALLVQLFCTSAADTYLLMLFACVFQ